MFEHRKRKKKIANAAVLANDSPDGTEVRVTGTVRVLERTLIAPASGRIAVIYGIQAADHTTHEPGGWAPQPAFTSVDTCPFVIDRGNGAPPVIIASDFAEFVDIALTSIDSLSQHWAAYCAERGLHTSIAHEAVIQPGHVITIVGLVERRVVEPTGEAGFREAGVATYLVGDFDRPLLVAPGRDHS